MIIHLNTLHIKGTFHIMYCLLMKQATMLLNHNVVLKQNLYGMLDGIILPSSTCLCYFIILFISQNTQVTNYDTPDLPCLQRINVHDVIFRHHCFAMPKIKNDSNLNCVVNGDSSFKMLLVHWSCQENKILELHLSYPQNRPLTHFTQLSHQKWITS